jgi:hypothetical protein
MLAIRDRAEIVKMESQPIMNIGTSKTPIRMTAYVLKVRCYVSCSNSLKRNDACWHVH